MSIRFIEPIDLRFRIERNDRNFHIIDVRDYDFESGHIKTPTVEQFHHLNLEVFTIEKAVELIHTYCKHLSLNCTESVDFIFHCFYSQQRGPTAAMRMVDAIEQGNIDTSIDCSKIGVKVLRGGWGLWNTRYFNDDSMIVPVESEDEESISSSSSSDQ